MKIFLSISIVLILLSSCNREPTDVTTYLPPVINPSSIDVLAGLVGTITTNGNLPVEDAHVLIKGHQTMTDANGNFSFENVMLYQDGSLIEVSKPGFYLGSRKIYALEGETNVMEVELIPLTDSETIMSTQVNEVNADELKIVFPAGSYMLGANDSYSGEMNVHVVSMSSQRNNYNKMPGDLTGASTIYEIKALSNLGFFNASLTSQFNEQLELPENSSAQFELKLADVSENPLPSDISLFYFDQSNGTWLEKGLATLVNDSYVGEIDALGYWMLGQMHPYAEIEGSLSSPDGSFLNTRLEIHDLEDSYLNSLRATRSGRYLSRVPQELDLDLSIFHECAIGNQTEEIGFVTQNEIIDLIDIETDMENMVIEGQVKACAGGPSTKPFVLVNFRDQQYLYRTDVGGDFEFSFANCSDTEVAIRAIDIEEQKISEVNELGIENSINTGEMETCDTMVAGYDISYDFMDWNEELEDKVDHIWEIARISGQENKLIFSTKMIDRSIDKTYLKAAFVFKENETLADYQLTFGTQGFHVFGECEVEELNYGGLKSYRFHGLGDDFLAINNGVFPDVEQVSFSLVYYD